MKWITNISLHIGLFLDRYWAELFALCIVFIAIWVVDQLYQLDGDRDAEYWRDVEW